MCEIPETKSNSFSTSCWTGCVRTPVRYHAFFIWISCVITFLFLFFKSCTVFQNYLLHFQCHICSFFSWVRFSSMRLQDKIYQNSCVTTLLWSKIQIKNFDGLIEQTLLLVSREKYLKNYKKRWKREGFVEYMPKSNVTVFLWIHTVWTILVDPYPFLFWLIYTLLLQ